MLRRGLQVWCRSHIRDKLQKPAKNYIRKICEIDWCHTCATNNLTSFVCEVRKNQKRKYCKSAENCLEKIVTSHQVNLFLTHFTHLEPLWVGAYCATHASSFCLDIFLPWFEWAISPKLRLTRVLVR